MVYPDDARYSRLCGQSVIHPFRNNESIPIIFDTSVDPEFGTGIVKITPAHDATDFAMGRRHGLTMPAILTDGGKIAESYGQFSGMRRFDARLAIVATLTDLELFVDIENHCNVIPICSKSKDVIEPMLKDQWYIRCQEMATDAFDAQQRGDLRLLPEGIHENVWSHWLKDSHDWCISRQLWWGHQIPAYLVVSDHGTESLKNNRILINLNNSKVVTISYPVLISPETCWCASLDQSQPMGDMYLKIEVT